ncbi:MULTISPECIES: META domain-containing protein [Trueperella]|uniref:META domain protein n=1 Tax=Trueperella bernardiae TaxID=59561 RepID=A0A0W1KMA3_9ACTO|nr:MULTISPECIES: META domain-containing protein [Trueperella]KTF04702.1 META domain protein [Trueperella bernardiae]MDK8602773.1 META domain-containing protein [Trueperella bernardiae]OFS65703.1 hypothetical protein HMPREF3174_06555 [Trueperella sp. HMSC08H06]WIM08484.1 META domain-containing protein [Trueperella bernardiae]
MRRGRRLGFIIGAALLMAGCSTQGGASAVGTWTDAENEAVYLELADDGTLSGSDGCNDMGGHWSAAADKIQFTEVFATLKYCEGVDTWLADVSSATVDGDEMSVYNDAGEAIGTLHR